MAKHFVKCPGVSGDYFIRIWRCAGVGPLVDGNRYWLCFEFRNAFQIFLIVLVFRSHLSGRRAFPLNQGLWAGADFLSGRQISSLSAARVKMFADHIHVVEAVGEKVAAPISWREIVR